MILPKASLRPAFFLFLSTAATTMIPSYAAPTTTYADIRASLWSQLGLSVGGENIGDHTGHAVATSAEGNIIAVGSPHYTSSYGHHAGRVRVYEYKSHTNEWRKIGRDIVGDMGDEMGRSVALSITGEYLAIGSPKCSVVVVRDDDNEEEVIKKEAGCVRVYERTSEFGVEGSDEYELLGQIMTGQDSFDHFGHSVAINDVYSEDSNDLKNLKNGGLIEDLDVIQVAIGAPGAKNGLDEMVGRVYMKEFVIDGSNAWKDASLNGDSQPFIGQGEPGSQFGTSVSMSIDDDLLVVGAPRAVNKFDPETTLHHAGQVSMYQRVLSSDGTKRWFKIDSLTFLGDDEGDECGTSVSMTLRGTYVAYGCPKSSYYDGDTLIREAGRVHVWKLHYDSQTNKWHYEVASPDQDTILIGESSGDFFGQSIAIGEDAEYDSNNIFLAVGAPNHYYSSTMQKSGFVMVYHLKDATWYSANLQIDGDNAFDEFGTSVSVSYDGHRVVGGAPGASGYAQMYELKFTAPPTTSPTRKPTGGKKPSKPTKPTKPGTLDDLNYDNTHKSSGVSPFLLALLFLVFIPAVLFLIFKGFMYWRGRRHYNSEFGADVRVASPADLELTAQSGGATTSSAEVSRDII